MPNIGSITFLNAKSHSMKLTYGAEIDKEEVFLTYETTWRGEPAFVTMSCDRYRHSSGLSDWRVYASEVRKAERGDHHTETARSRLHKEIQPLATAWLDTDSYRVSQARALMHAVKRTLKDSYRGSADARKLIAEPWIQRLLGASLLGLIERACDAQDSYEAALERI